jgi:hypothetical protein
MEGVLKSDDVLPLKEHERVVVAIQPLASRTGATFWNHRLDW